MKNEIINLISNGEDKEAIVSKVINLNLNFIDEIKINSNIQIIIKDKSNEDVEETLNDLINDHLEQENLKKIESLEQKLINNLDESSYSELIKLKSQLNRE